MLIETLSVNLDTYLNQKFNTYVYLNIEFDGHLQKPYSLYIILYKHCIVKNSLASYLKGS